VGIAVLAIVIITAVTAGSKKSGTPTASTVASSATTAPGASASTPASASTTAAPSKSAPVAHVGSTISLTDESGNKFNVTVVQVVDPGQGTDTFTTADAGTRFVGVEFKFTNSGTATISPTPDNEATVIDFTGHGESPDVGSQLSNCAPFPDNISISSGSSLEGCETFDVPSGATVAKIQYTPSSGFASDTGQWLNP